MGTRSRSALGCAPPASSARAGPAQGQNRLVREEQELPRGTEELLAGRRRPDWFEAPHQHAAHGALKGLDALAHG
jgi:hypothetical protein